MVAGGSGFRLSARSAQIVRDVRDGVLIGVVDGSSGVVELYESAPGTDVAGGKYPGHRELVRAGALPPAGGYGFSLELAGGAVRRFYRASILNRNFDDFVLPPGMMEGVLGVVGLPRSDDFRAYP